MRPAAFNEDAVYHSRRTVALPLHSSGAHISTLFFVVLVGHDVIIFYRIQNPRPVNCGQVTQFVVLLNPHSASSDVHQVVEADLLQMNHLKNDQCVIKEQMSSSNHSEVGEKSLQTLQTVHTKEQQVVCNHSELRKAELTEIFRLGFKHQQDLQVALDDSAVLEHVQPGQIVADVHAPANWEAKNNVIYAFIKGNCLSFLKTQFYPTTSQCIARLGICSQMLFSKALSVKK